MNYPKQNYLQMKQHYQKRKREAEENLKQLDTDYIEANAEYPIGTKLQIDDYGEKKEVVIQNYRIDENGLLEPIYVTLEGKAQFVHKPTIIKEL